MRKLKTPIVIESTAPWLGMARFVFTHFDNQTQQYYDPSSGGVLSKETLARLKRGQIKYHTVIEPEQPDGPDRRRVSKRAHHA